MTFHSPKRFDCSHCGTQVPIGLINRESPAQFCCSGCATAYRIIYENKLQSFYDIVQPNDSKISLKNENSQDDVYEEFDHESFLEKYSGETKNSLRTGKLAIQGIHCAACIWLIEKLPAIVPGVVEARVNWAKKNLHITWDQQQAPLSLIARTLAQLGYPPVPFQECEREQRFRLDNRKHLARIGIAAALAGNNMIISAALYFGMFEHMDFGITQLMRTGSCAIGLASLLIPGRIFLQNAWAAMRVRTPHMDLPIALALFLGTMVGTMNVIRGVGEIYFDSLSVLIFLLLIGRWLQFRQQAKAAEAVDLLQSITPRTARKIADGQTTQTLAELLRVGDLVEVRAGEVVPVDGHVIAGESLVDESILTGESTPVTKAIDSHVFAGTRNDSSRLVVHADAVNESTRVSGLARLVEDSGLERPQVVQWANAVGGYFVIAVSVLATAAFMYWLRVDINIAVDRAIALLIVACPCALALATPLAIAVATTRAAQAGILIKSGDVFQLLQEPGEIWLDKTGTLTEGQLRVDAWHGNPETLPLISMIESHSQHPVAQALVRFANSQCDDIGPGHPCNQNSERIRRTVEHPGKGMFAETERLNFAIGNRLFMKEQKVLLTDENLRFAESISEKGLSPCWIAIDRRVVAIAGLGDSIRPEASHALTKIQQRGWQIGILSGDHQDIVNRVAKRLRVNLDRSIGNASPEEKLNRINESTSARNVMMVGDGVNDCAALAAASVGLAVNGGAEASLVSAPVYLSRPGLTPILDLFKISDSAASTMKICLGVSIVYNCVFAAMAFVGLINPLVAAIAMPISSLTVVSISLRSGCITQERQAPGP